MIIMNAGENDYYEVISDEETFESEDVKIAPAKDEAISLDFDDLPFVPKFSSEIRNTVESVSTNENDSEKAPLVGDWGSHSRTIKPTPHLSCPYFPDQSIPVPVAIIQKPKDVECHPLSSTPFTVTPNESCSQHINSKPLINNLSDSESYSVIGHEVGQKQNEDTNSKQVNKNVCETKKPDWVDENGDPIQGAFDSIDSSGSALDSCVNIVNNTKVEYVFHVKEKKNDVITKSDSDVGSVSDGISFGTVSSLTNVVSDSLLIPNSLSGDNIQESTVSGAVDSFDEKRLYEASKNKHELCNINSQNENTGNFSGVGGSKNILFKKKVEHTVFKRNDFINQTKGETVEETTAEQITVEPTASTGEKALESQALNELLREVKLGAERAKSFGALGWQKQPIPVVNKRFLKNTLVSTLRKPYKPPSRRGCHHEGLKKEDRESSDSSSSSRSRSRSSSSYSSSSSSRSSRSSRSRSRSRSKKHHGDRRRGEDGGPWPGGPPPGAFYDWGAMGQYGGYQCYDPQAMGMFYGAEGYPGMYYNDPQFWAAYCDYYGIGGGYHNNVGFRGRGVRGRRWRGRGRGGGGDGDGHSLDMQDESGEYGFYNNARVSVSRSRSRSPSQNTQSRSRKSGGSRSQSPDISSNKSRSSDSRNKSKSKKDKSSNRDSSEGSCSKLSSSKTSQGGDGEIKDSKRLKNMKKKGETSSNGPSLGDSVKKEKKKKKGKKLKKKQDAIVEGDSSSQRVDGEDKGITAVSPSQEQEGHVKKTAKRKHETAVDEEKPERKKKKIKKGVKKSETEGKGKGKSKKDGSTKVKGKMAKAAKDIHETGKGCDLPKNDPNGQEGFSEKRPDSVEAQSKNSGVGVKCLQGSSGVERESTNERERKYQGEDKRVQGNEKDIRDRHDRKDYISASDFRQRTERVKEIRNDNFPNSSFGSTRKLNKIEEIEKRLRERKAKKNLEDGYRQNEEKMMNRKESPVMVKKPEKDDPSNEEVDKDFRQNKEIYKKDTDESVRLTNKKTGISKTEKSLKKTVKKKLKTKDSSVDKGLPEKKIKKGKGKKVVKKSKGDQQIRKKKFVSDTQSSDVLKNDSDSHKHTQDKTFSDESKTKMQE